MFGLFVLGFASANTPSPLKQHSQARLTARVSTFTLRQKWRLFVFSVSELTGVRHLMHGCMSESQMAALSTVSNTDIQNWFIVRVISRTKKCETFSSPLCFISLWGWMIEFFGPLSPTKTRFLKLSCWVPAGQLLALRTPRFMPSVFLLGLKD